MTPMLKILFILPIVCLGLAHKEPCNPRKDEGCVARNHALHGVVKDSLNRSSVAFDPSSKCPHICTSGNGTTLGILQRYDNPRMTSADYLLYGKVEADIMGAPGRGIISSFYLQSDDLDEIDIAEVFGNDQAKYQTNFFVKGDVAGYADGIYHALSNSTTQNYHRYGVRWNRLEIDWTLDGQVVRHKTGGVLPSSPMRVIFSLWVGGDGTNNPGTVEWAGGLTDFTKLPFSMYVKNIYVENYTEGDYYVYGRNLTVFVETERKANQVFGRWNVTR